MGLYTTKQKGLVNFNTILIWKLNYVNWSIHLIYVKSTVYVDIVFEFICRLYISGLKKMPQTGPKTD